MRTRGDKSLAKIYKDLMITKRELIDIRQSITSTLSTLKYSQRRPHSLKKKMCHRCGQRHDPGIPHQCLASAVKCPICVKFFPSKDNMVQHTHHQCTRCMLHFQCTQEVHDNFYCGQVKLECERCGAVVKRKQIEGHVSVCHFQACRTCRKLVYYQAYGYHISQCRNTEKKITSKLLKRTDQNRTIEILPCCLTPIKN